MSSIEFYKKLDADFSICEGEEELRGLTNCGFEEGAIFRVSNFNRLELNAARDMIACYLRIVGTFNKKHSSYELKHLIERALAKETDSEINYISNGALILAMYDFGFRIKRLKGEPNCMFNVSEKSIKRLQDFLER